MKLLIIITLVLFSLTACGPSASKTLEKKIPNKEIEEGMVASKKIPVAISGYRFNKTTSSFYRNDVSKDVQKRTIDKIKKGQRLANKAGRLKVKPEPVNFKEPYWADYFGEKAVSGTVRFNLRIGKDGKPDIIIVEKGIDQKIDVIAAKYISESKFKPGINAKNNKPVRAWIKINKSFN